MHYLVIQERKKQGGVDTDDSRKKNDQLVMGHFGTDSLCERQGIWREVHNHFKV
jgi:hypothetical protein